jgi:poly-gamma-glutamate capsule biosynthesis protein CapA/YwtB (metallophosphatase superfamily)
VIGALVATVALATATVALPVGNSRAPANAASAGSHLIAFGGAPAFSGEVPDDAVGAAASPTGAGFVVAGAGGSVGTFGDARHAGDPSGPLNAAVLDVVTTPTGGGYWLIAGDGGVFTFGDAGFHGSTGAMTLNQPIVGMAATPTGHGYWLVARDGGIFAFGDAGFHGSAAGRLPPGAAAVSLEVRPQADGYWVVAGRREVRLALAGDVHGERHLGDELRRGGNPLQEVSGILAAADVAAVNLETPAGSPGTPQPKQYVFLAPPELLTALRASGIDVVSLANNHALDHGAGTLLETVRRARGAGLAVVGAGANAAEAFRPAYLDVRGRRVAFVGLSRVVPPGWAATASRAGVASAYDERAAIASIREARAQADVVVVLVHWGIELDRCPGAGLVRLADAWHAAGADVVAGHHPHVLQGIDARPDRVTAYSLGNFVWYHAQEPSATTGVLEVAVGAGRSVASTFHPARIGGDGHPRFLAGAEADAVRHSVSGGPCRR